MSECQAEHSDARGERRDGTEIEPPLARGRSRLEGCSETQDRVLKAGSPRLMIATLSLTVYAAAPSRSSVVCPLVAACDHAFSSAACRRKPAPAARRGAGAGNGLRVLLHTPARRIWAIRGRGGPGIPVWPRRPTRTNKGNIPLFIIGVDAVKDAVYARLRLAEPGPGAIHFRRRLDADYFRQLTVERVVTRFERGRPIRSWQPKRDGERNEALDTTVYAMAALHGLISMGLRLNEEADVPAKGAPAPGQPAEPPRVIRSRWMGAI